MDDPSTSEADIELGFDDDIESAYRRALDAIDEAQLDAPADSSNANESGDGGEPLRAGPRIHARQVIEAALFVGGLDLTLKRLSELLGDEYSADSIERMVAELDEKYRRQNRPYEIVFGEGGYRLSLSSDYEPIRASVFGLGPREIRLTPETLEVLSLVAYRQPITREEIEHVRDGNAGSILNNLVRRGLIDLRREKDQPKTTRYVTTDRFLEVFGLAELDDLPQIENLRFK